MTSPRSPENGVQAALHASDPRSSNRNHGFVRGPGLRCLAQGGGAEVASLGGSLPGSPAIELVKVADGLADPVSVASPPDDSGRLFIVERLGRIRVLQDGKVLEEPFLDLSDDVLSAFLEQGLYDVAFHPGFAENGLFYVLSPS